MSSELEVLTNEPSDYDLSAIGDALSTFIEQGTDAVLSVFNSDEFSVVFESITEISADLIKASKVLKVIQKAASIPDKIFMNKMEQYCKGLINIPEAKRQDYISKIGKDKLNKDSVFILGLLNKIEELSKIDILLALFEAKMDEVIEDDTYRRLSLMVDRTLFADLTYLQSNITDEHIVIDNDHEQGLLANGWLYYVGMSWGTATEESQQLYKYANFAKQFCNILNK